MHIEPVKQADGTADALESLATVRATRDDAAVKAALGRLDSAAAGGENTMPALLDAVRAYATMGEICTVLRGRWGRFHENV
jgi:methylmalonyl-CoA mutase N-terminal domain/subunit